MIKAIQEQQAKIELLESKLDALEGIQNTYIWFKEWVIQSVISEVPHLVVHPVFQI